MGNMMMSRRALHGALRLHTQKHTHHSGSTCVRCAFHPQLLCSRCSATPLVEVDQSQAAWHVQSHSLRRMRQSTDPCCNSLMQQHEVGDGCWVQTLAPFKQQARLYSSLCAQQTNHRPQYNSIKNT